MASNANLKNIYNQEEVNIQLINKTGQVVGLTDPIVTDIIVILDNSSSMMTMGNEPIKSVNAFLEEQLAGDVNEGATFSFIAFNTKRNVIINNVPLVDMKPISKDICVPFGTTALNDTVCETIKETLASKKPNDKIVVIITDGKENSSKTYKTSDVKRMVKDCQDNNRWEFIFLGANIDAFAEGQSINICSTKCAQFSQKNSGDLLQMVRQTSANIFEYRRARSKGRSSGPLVAAPSIVPLSRANANITIKCAQKSYNTSSSPTSSTSNLLCAVPDISRGIEEDGRSYIQSPRPTIIS